MKYLLKDEMKHMLDRTKVRRIHTVNTKRQCDFVDGFWDKKTEACLIREIEPYRWNAMGWTAPVFGAYAWWHVGDVYKDGEDTYGGKIGLSMANHCPEYPNDICPDSYIYDEDIDFKPSTDWDNISMQYRNIRTKAMELASDIAKGKAHKYGLIYCNDEGDFMDYPHSKTDFVSCRPCGMCASFGRPKDLREPPFSLKER